MCEPTTIVMAVSAVVGVLGAAYQARENAKAVNEMAAVQQEQINDQATEQKNERIKAAREARAQARAAAAESGVAGNSLDAILNDALMQSGRDVSIIEKNRKNGVAASAAEASARIRTANAEATSSIANTAVGFYSDYSAYKIGGK